MSMTTGDELGKSDMFMKFAVSLFPLVEEAVRQGMTLKEFEGGMLGGLLSTGKALTDRFLLSQGDGNLGDTIVHPTAGGASPEPDEGTCGPSISSGDGQSLKKVIPVDAIKSSLS